MITTVLINNPLLEIKGLILEDKYSFYEDFRKEVYNYCERNKGNKILFAKFKNLWPFLEEQIIPKDLNILTSKVIEELIMEGILEEISSRNQKHVGGLYRIFSEE